MQGRLPGPTIQSRIGVLEPAQRAAAAQHACPALGGTLHAVEFAQRQAHARGVAEGPAGFADLHPRGFHHQHALQRDAPLAEAHAALEQFGQ